MNSTKKGLYPSLRFPEFRDEWKSAIFNEVFEFYQTNTFSRNEMNAEKGIVRNIHYGDILIKYGSVINDTANIPFLNSSVDLTRFRDNSYLQNGDIIISDTAEDLIAGKAVEVRNIDCKILAGLHTMLCRPKNIAAAGFYGYYLNSPIYHDSIIPLITGSKVCSITKSNIIQTYIIIPTLPEQQKIADCLSSLDELINGEIKKLEAYKLHKKGMMQKLFPAEGRSVPEYRFPEFRDSGDWEENTLGKILIKNSIKNKDSKITLVQSVSNKYGFINQYDYFEDRIVASNDTSNYYIITKGCFAYNPSRIDVGSLAYKCNNEISIISPLYVSFKADNNKIVDIFLLNWFFSNNFKSQMIFEGGVRNTLNYENLREIKISIPQKLEQQKIADCLSSLDELISEQAKKIESLKVHKKGLMQRLFPSV